MRYGRFRYGTGVLYGSSGTPNLLWGLEIDWDGDGRFDGSNEARYAVDMWCERGRRGFINEDGNGFERVLPGKFYAVLENKDERYDPYNLASPLYPLIRPGLRVRVTVQEGAGGTRYEAFRGRLKDLAPQADDEQAQLEAADDTTYLSSTPVTLAVQMGARVDDLMHLVLDHIGWPAAERAIDAATDVIPYWWADGVSAWEALCGLAEAVLGSFFIAADGKATFLSRAHANTAAVTLEQSELGKAIRLPQPWENMRNVIKVEARPRVAVPDTELWRYQEKPAIAAGGTLEVWTDFTAAGESVPASVVTAPIPVTDYTFNSAADGSGTDMTYSFTVIPYAFGKTALLRIVNNSASTGYPTLLKIRGTALTLPDTSTAQVDAGAAEKMVFRLESDWLQDTNLAKSFADFLGDNLPLVRAFPEVRLTARPALQFALDLGTRAAISAPAKGINAIYACSWLSWRWLASTGQAVETEARFEPLPAGSVQWRFTVKMGEESYFAF